jgi:hypothetical protein
MKDLIERLRFGSIDDDLLDAVKEAADALEAQAARIAELEALVLHAADLLDDASDCIGLGPDAALRWFACKDKFRDALKEKQQ